PRVSAHAQQRRALSLRDRPRESESGRSLAALARGHRPSFCTASRKGGRTLRPDRHRFANFCRSRAIASPPSRVRARFMLALAARCEPGNFRRHAVSKRSFITAAKPVYECCRRDCALGTEMAMRKAPLTLCVAGGGFTGAAIAIACLQRIT